MECHCLIRHAITLDERAIMAHRLEEARMIGDMNGIIIALASLSSKYPARENKESV